MTSRKGGYIIIDLTSTTLVDDLEVALSFGKPVLVYNANNEANYYTLSYDDDNDVYTLIGAKDGFTINSEGTITPVVSGGKVYLHDILLTKSDNSIVLKVYSTKSTALTFNELLTLIGGLGITTNQSGVVSAYAVVENVIYDDITSAEPITFDSTSTITDTIVEI